MNDLNFWSAWERSHQLSFKILGVLTLLIITSGLVIVLGDVSYVYTWEVTGVLKNIPKTVFSDHGTLIESILHVDVPLLFQKVAGGYEQLPLVFVYVFAIILYLAVAGCMTVVSYLGRFWYVVSMGLLVVLLVVSGISQIGIFGIYNEYAIGIPALLFVVVSYYFQSINTSISSGIRFLSFVGVLILILGIVLLFSEHDTPVLYIAYHSYWSAVVISVVFALLVGHEVVYAILILTTQESKSEGNGNGLHFTVLSLVYLLNLIMLYLHNAKYIDWDIYYINPFLLLGVSSILGVWGLKGRQHLYDKVLAFRPYMLWLYFSLAIVCFTTISFVILSGNDPAIEALEDAIVFGHIGFGCMFFIYIIANFVNLLLKGMPIYKIAFKEDNFPYATSKLGGAVVVAAFFFASNYAPFSQAVSGFYNHMGDMELGRGEVNSAKEYYERGSMFGNFMGGSNNNHKSNYMLAVLSEDEAKTIYFWDKASHKKPSEYSYASLGMAYENSNQFFEAVFAYQDGLLLYPKSWGLMNNLALLYDRIDVTDSSRYYLTKESSAQDWQHAILQSNLIATAASQGFDIERDNLDTDRVDVLSNLLAKGIINGDIEDNNPLLESTATSLNLFTYSYLKNLGLTCLSNMDRTYLDVVDAILANPANDDFSFDLSLIKAMNLYKNGLVRDAFDLLNQLKLNNPDKDSMLNTLLGKWSMELGSPLLAANYFEKAREHEYPLSTVDLAQAYALTGRGSVGAYILNNEIEVLDTTRVNILAAMRELEGEVLEGKVGFWQSSYSFAIESRLLAHANSMLQKKEIDAAKIGFLELGQMNPFYNEGVLGSARFFNRKDNNADQAYGILLDAIRVNEFSAELIIAYIDQCLSMGLTSYADATVIRLIDILPYDEYQAYEVAYEEKKIAAQANLDSNW